MKLKKEVKVILAILIIVVLVVGLYIAISVFGWGKLDKESCRGSTGNVNGESDVCGDGVCGYQEAIVTYVEKIPECEECMEGCISVCPEDCE